MAGATGMVTQSERGWSDDDLPPLLGRRFLLWTGETLLTLGVVVLLFAAYLFYGTSWQTDRAQRGLDDALTRLWSLGVPPEPGQPAGRLYIPRIRDSWVVVEGVSAAQLAKGPGHYPASDQPGDVGNLAIAGHRTTSVFWKLDLLRRGGPVVVETRTGWFVYRVTRTRVVRPEQAEVIRSNPYSAKKRPTHRLLTLTTCHPRFQNYQRLIVHAELSRAMSKKAGRPPELAGPT